MLLSSLGERVYLEIRLSAAYRPPTSSVKDKNAGTKIETTIPLQSMRLKKNMNLSPPSEDRVLKHKSFFSKREKKNSIRIGIKKIN